MNLRNSFFYAPHSSQVFMPGCISVRPPWILTSSMGQSRASSRSSWPEFLANTTELASIAITKVAFIIGECVRQVIGMKLCGDYYLFYWHNIPLIVTKTRVMTSQFFLHISSFTTQLIKIQIQEEIQTQIQMQTQIQRMTERGRGESLITIRGWPRVILGPSAACIASSQDWITVIWMNWIARNWIGSLGFAHQRNFFSGLLSLCPVDNSPKHIKHKHI